MAVIPGSLTKKLQPLDITVNKPFKDQLRTKWENWMMGGIHEYNKTGQMKRPSYKDIVAWIVESWAAVNKNCVRNGFIKARGEKVVSVDSDYVHDDTFSEMEAEEIPNTRLILSVSSPMKNFLDLNSVMFNK